MNDEVQNGFIISIRRPGRAKLQRKSQMSLHQLPKNQKPWYVIDLNSVVGKPHGLFKLTQGSKAKVLNLEPASYILEMKKELLKDATSGESNEKIWDDGTAQQLKKEDIDNLRQRGLTGTEIVTHLVENSKTFQIKTEFSQEKYLNKKEQKYGEFVEILRPNIRTLAKFFHQEDPTKVMNLRPDTLAMIMSLANIKCDGRYGVFDGGCQGMITASILDRMQGQGTVWNLYLKGAQQKKVIQAMNFTPQEMKPLVNLSLVKLKANLLTASTSDEGETPAKIPRLDAEAAGVVEQPLELGSLHGLVIACRKPGMMAKELIKLLAPSGNFVLFSPHIEPLSDIYVQFRESNLAVNLKLTETWFRNYQVLPSRTHPEVMMSGSGGYILSGIKVLATD
uniref:tRNA (adenine(58)-N(1))-methyltransferase non-catalytic subunit TRM6 n=1 Tax=Eubosmina coregoni TaxID=186181 RepID=A0A4Y7LPA2_9CRUS|nr:EOG090X0AAB [Eubosmina coregoni]